MIKCKQAMESPACGKVCCCLDCEEIWEGCPIACDNLSENCKDRVTEENALAIMQTEAAAIIKGIAALPCRRSRLRIRKRKCGFSLWRQWKSTG